MQNWARWTFIGLATAAFGFMLWMGYDMYTVATAEKNEHIDALPSDALMVFSSDKPLDEWAKLLRNNPMWEQLIENAELAELDQMLNEVDSVLRQDKSTHQSLAGMRLAMGLYPDGPGKRTFIWVLEFPSQQALNLFSEKAGTYFKQALSPSDEVRGKKVSELQYAGKKWHLFTHNNLFVCTSSATMLEKSAAAIEQKQGLSNDPKFTKVWNVGSANPGVTARVLVQFSRIAGWLSGIISQQKLDELLTDALPFAGWSEFDLYLSPNKIQGNGVTLTANGGLSTIFQGQQPVEPTFQFLIPSSAYSVIALTLSNKELFLEKLAAIRFSGGYEDWKAEISNYSTTYNVDVEYGMLRWLGSEWISFSLPGHEKLMAFSIGEGQTGVESQLQQFAQTADTSIISQGGFSTNNMDVFEVNLPVSYGRLLGSVFSDQTNLHFCRVNNYLILAPSADAMRAYLNGLQRASLADQVRFDGMLSGTFSNKGNLYLLASPSRASNTTNWFDEEFAKTNSPIHGFLKNVEWMGMQWKASGSKKLFAASLFDFNSSESSNTLLNWEAMLDKPVLGTAHLINNHQTHGVDLLIQDMSYRLYLLSSTGKVRWQRDLNGPILSDISQLDIYDNGKLQMAFVADGKLMVLDILGRDVKNFPVGVPNGSNMQLIGKGKALRFAVTVDDEIWIFSDEGKVLRKINHGEHQSDILASQLFSWGQQFYLAAIASDGYALTTLLSDTREQVFEVQNISAGSAMFVEKGSDVETSRLVYLNERGNIVRVMSTIGGVTDSITASAPHGAKFILADVNGDNNLNYVVLANRNLKAWSRDKSEKTLWTHQGELSRKIHVSDFGGFKKYITITDSDSGELIVLSATGNEITEGKYKGVDQALVTDLNNDNRLELVIIFSNGSIKQYPVD